MYISIVIFGNLKNVRKTCCIILTLGVEQTLDTTLPLDVTIRKQSCSESLRTRYAKTTHGTQAGDRAHRLLRRTES